MAPVPVTRKSEQAGDEDIDACNGVQNMSFTIQARQEQQSCGCGSHEMRRQFIEYGDKRSLLWIESDRFRTSANLGYLACTQGTANEKNDGLQITRRRKIAELTDPLYLVVCRD